MAGRFVAGESVEEAIVAARKLGREGIGAMLDHLGENVASPEQASAAADQYALALKRLREADDVDGSISVKLTQLGLDVSYDLCLENAERVLEAAAESGVLVMIDMEGHRYVDPTLRAHRDLRERFPRIGVCLQAYLRRSARDVFDLPATSTIRLVKGAYLEPESVAFPTRSDVDRSFAVAWRRVEFQMLYGIRRDIQQRLAGDHYPVRVYIPYGTEWYPYLTRRLAERPANMWFFAQNLLRMRRG